MISHELLAEVGILMVTPEGPLEAADFDALAKEVDPYLEQQGELNGLLIQAEAFAGWSDFAGLISHLRFVREHHQRIKRVAVVSDSRFLAIAPRLAQHFVAAELRHFEIRERSEALGWLQEHESATG
jgi:hypothetical protein